MKRREGGLAIRRLGRVAYADARVLQRELVERRADGEIPDTLVVCEHPHVITVGRGLRGERGLAADSLEGPDGPVPVVQVERGGEATYHGPGQVVVYAILRLDRVGRGLDAILRGLEEMAIRCCRDFGVEAARKPGCTGVWVGLARSAQPRPATGEAPARCLGPDPGARKVASIGVAVRRWVTYHGMALNVDTDLRYFHLIRPCGFDPAVMTSLAVERGERVDPAHAAEAVAHHAAEVLSVDGSA